MNVSTLKPGLLVSLKTSIVGNTAYDRVEIEPDHVTEAGTKQARWETKRVITDPKEHEKARQVRSECRYSVSKVCSPTTFGLLCPEDRREELDAAIKEAQKSVRQFNSTSKLSRVGVYVIVGRVAADDAEAVRAINSEVRDLMTAMEQGLRDLDVKAVRAAASKAQSIGRMLSPEAASRIKVAIVAARESARRIGKAGEEAAQAIDRVTLRRIRESRTAFLDMDEPEEVTIGDNPAKIETRAIDFDPEPPLPLPLPPRKPDGPKLEV